MKLIFCLSKDNGMMFFGKRQSKDSKLIEWIVDHVGESRIWVSNYSAKLFEGGTNIIADDDYVNKASQGDYCFIEDKAYSVDGVSEIFVCRWNRAYPGDKFFDIDLKKNNFKKSNSIDIVGSSHDKITIEMYKKG